MNESQSARNYYSILGAERDAAQDEIERRYKRLAVLHHPDRGGDEEEMKTINEAYEVLGNVDARRVYDAECRSSGKRTDAAVPPLSSPSAQADALGGRIVGALLCLGVGLALLLLVRFQYIWFLWPLAILAASVVFAGIWMAHAALVFARESFAPAHLARRFVWVQEIAFWACVGGGVYGLYLVMSVI